MIVGVLGNGSGELFGTNDIVAGRVDLFEEADNFFSFFG